MGATLCLLWGTLEEEVKMRLVLLRPNDGPLAQLVEQRTFNPLVVGSIPTRPTNKSSTYST